MIGVEMTLSTAITRAVPKTASRVLSGRDWLQVIGPHARPVPTQMIELESLGNRTDEELVHEPMRVHTSVSGPELSVSLAVLGCQP